MKKTTTVYELLIGGRRIWIGPAPHASAAIDEARKAGFVVHGEVAVRTGYLMSAPSTPGARPTHSYVSDLAAARARAASCDERRDLRYTDVRIERLDGSLVEYAGPSR